MKKIMTVMGGIVLVALIAIVGVYAQQEKATGSIPIRGDHEAVLAGMAKISFDSALGEALKAVPGKVVKAELENENGTLVYGVEIAKADRQIAEVKVDAGSGKVLKIETDQKDQEDREGEDSDNGHEKNEK